MTGCSNFKKKPSQKNKPGWHYKARAVEKIAGEFAELFCDLKEKRYLCAIPPSKAIGHAEYDCRLEDMLKRLSQLAGNVEACPVITRAYSVEAAHEIPLGQKRHSIEDHLKSFKWDLSIGRHLDHLILVDDVLTAGTQFKACQRLALAAGIEPDRIAGVFWARRVFPKHEPDT
jgi:predicted amidophosphoribosyltransferase